MVDTKVQRDVEKWVRNHWMRNHFQQEFHSANLKLRSGGHFEFDAVNQDHSIVASISTSAAKTARGNFGTGKFMKLRSDMLFLVLLKEQCQKFLILTDNAMYDACLKQHEIGRTPGEIEFLLATIPDQLHEQLIKARDAASQEVTPQFIQAEVPDEILLETDPSAPLDSKQ